MLEGLGKANKFEYKRLTEEEQTKRGILGRLVGIIADSKQPTRNGRLYSRELWENVFNNPIMKEQLENRVCLGELGHPADRTETDIEKVAICLAEQPKIAEDGKVYGVFDILNTPNGKILKSLCDYGCNIGVSSRGEGDLISDFDGNESVDPDTYECKCWDAVLLPAVQAARPAYVKESLQTSKKKSLKESLEELYNESSDEDKRVMQDTIKQINEALDDGWQESDLENEKAEDESTRDLSFDEFKNYAEQFGVELTPQKYEDIVKLLFGENADEEHEDTFEEMHEAVDNSEAEIVNQLQEALSGKKSLESKVIELQEKLSVSYAKEAQQRDTITRNKAAISKLSEDAKHASALQEKYSKAEAERAKLAEEISQVKQEIKTLKASIQSGNSVRASLTENINGKAKKINVLTEQLNKVTAENTSLNESVQNLKKDLELKKSDYANKIDKANKLVEKYQRAANKAVDKYIESQAIKLGVTSNEIKNRLPESYSFDDIDNVAEDLQGYKLNMSRLPFQLTEEMSMKAKPSSKKQLIPRAEEDEIDDSLLRLAKMK